MTPEDYLDWVPDGRNDVRLTPTSLADLDLEAALLDARLVGASIAGTRTYPTANVRYLFQVDGRTVAAPTFSVEGRPNLSRTTLGHFSAENNGAAAAFLGQFRYVEFPAVLRSVANAIEWAFLGSPGGTLCKPAPRSCVGRQDRSPYWPSGVWGYLPAESPHDLRMAAGFTLDKAVRALGATPALTCAEFSELCRFFPTLDEPVVRISYVPRPLAQRSDSQGSP